MRAAFANMTQADRVELIQVHAQELVDLADELGVSVRIDRVPLEPLASGNMRHVVNVWPARHQPDEWKEADEAFDNYYFKCRASMGRSEWRQKWLAGETPMQLARAAAEPIPTGVYYSAAHSNFYDHNGRGMGAEFMAKWQSRWSEFPHHDPARHVSDREWAAGDGSLREGSTKRVPGVEEL